MNITKDKLNTLKQRDPILSGLIENIGSLENPEPTTNHLKSAAKIIVSQQLSFKAANTIWNKLDKLIDKWQPEMIQNTSTDTMRNAGLSGQKANYIKTLAASVEMNAFSFEQLGRLDDEQAKKELTRIKGFGEWSAEMYLIFTLGREDIYSLGDAGLKRAVISLYKIDEATYFKNIEVISQNWSPYKSIAALYLWAWADSDL